MNRCIGLECSEEMSDISLSEDENDEPLHYSEEYIDSKSESDTVNSYLSDMSINMSEASSSTATSLAWMKTTKKMSQKSKPKAVEEGIKIFCPYEKKITISTLLPSSQYDLEAEAAMMKKIVRTNNLLYIPIQVKVKGEWINVDAFIDIGGSNNLARPSLFKNLWKPLKNILLSETVGGHVQLRYWRF